MGWGKSKGAGSKSEFDQEEDTYRVKSARAKYCSLGLDISGGLLKALPPLAITNFGVILALGKWLDKAATDEIAEIQRLIDIAETTFIFFILAFIVMAFMAWVLTPRLVKNERHAEWSDIKVRAIKADAISALADYKGDMPRLVESTLRKDALDDSGKLDVQWVRPNWRNHTKVTKKMRRNLEDLYPDLVGKMDKLTTSVTKYMESFNAYSAAFQRAYNASVDRQDGTKPLLVDEYAKGRIIGSYLWYSGIIQSNLDLEGAKSTIVQDDVTERYLRESMNGDPLGAESVSSLQTRSELKELAAKTRKDWVAAFSEYTNITSIIDEIRRRGV